MDRAPNLALEFGSAVTERQREAKFGIVDITLALAADALGEAIKRWERRGRLNRLHAYCAGVGANQQQRQFYGITICF